MGKLSILFLFLLLTASGYTQTSDRNIMLITIKDFNNKVYTNEVNVLNKFDQGAFVFESAEQFNSLSLTLRIIKYDEAFEETIFNTNTYEVDPEWTELYSDLPLLPPGIFQIKIYNGTKLIGHSKRFFVFNVRL